MKVVPSFFLERGATQRTGRAWACFVKGDTWPTEPESFSQNSLPCHAGPLGPALWTWKTCVWLWAKVLLWLTLENLVWIEDERYSDFQLRKLVCSEDPKFNLCETDGQVWPCLLIRQPQCKLIKSIPFMTQSRRTQGQLDLGRASRKPENVNRFPEMLTWLI